MLYALTESSLVSFLALSILPSFSATPYLPHSLWIALCLPELPTMCERRDDFRVVAGTLSFCKLGKMFME